MKIEAWEKCVFPLSMFNVTPHSISQIMKKWSLWLDVISLT